MPNYLSIHDRSQMRIALETLKKAKANPLEQERWVSLEYVINDVIQNSTLSADIDRRFWRLCFAVFNKNRPIRKLKLAELDLEPLDIEQWINGIPF